VTLVGVVGDDAAGRSLLKILGDERVDTELVDSVTTRPTTTKERFLGRAANRHPHQILRVDHETRDAIDADTAARLRDGILRCVAEHSVVVISDYAKGVCTPELLAAVIDATRDSGIPVVVDPARIADYRRYGRASLVTPNRDEAELATGVRINSPADALDAGRVLIEQTQLDAAFITIDRDGIAVVERGDKETRASLAATAAREVYDITGAGDMVVAVAGLCQAAGWPLDETARLANAAAGLEIEQLGIASVTWDQIEERYASARYDGPPSPSKLSRDIQINKIVTLPQLAQRVAEHRMAGKSIVFTNGCFDLLHVGHVAYLEEAAELGDVLIVAVNSDAGVRRLKGPRRPVIGESDRAAMLASLACVDHVLIFDEETPHQLLDCLRPDILVKGGTTDEVIGREVVEAYGGHVCRTCSIDGPSTTRIVAEIAAAATQVETPL